VIEIRQATAADVDGIIRVCTEANWATYRPQGLLSDKLIAASIAEYYNSERVGREVENISDAQSGYFVAVDSNTGEVVGAGCGGLWEPDVACLYCLYLDPNRKREGIGTRLLAAITDDAAARGAKEQIVHAAKGNQMAIPFYEAQGFEFVREEPNHLNGSPEWVAKRLIGQPNSYDQNTVVTQPQFSIRPTTPVDYPVTEMVTREAFWNAYGPGCDEHYLLHVMRGSEGFIPELDFVAVIDAVIVGNSVGDKSVIRTDDGAEVEVITLGPISVLPEYQNRGIGGALIMQAMDAAREMGFRAVILYGDPLYYSRFGFIPAETFDIRSGDDMYAEPLQVFELYPGALKGITGRYIENDIYEVDDAAVAEYDKNFPPKQTQEGTESQKRFQYLINSRKPRLT